MRIKRGVKIWDWHRTDIKKYGDETGEGEWKDSGELWWQEHVLLETQPTFH